MSEIPATSIQFEKKAKRSSGNETANLRAVLIMLVTIYHSVQIYVSPDFALKTTRQLPEVLSNPIVLTIGFILFNPMMALFFALSGYSLVFTLRKSTSYLVLLRKKFWRLLVPLMAVGLLWTIPIEMIGKSIFQGMSFPQILWSVYVTGDKTGHLWFLEVLLAMFIVFGWCYRCFGMTWKADVAVIVVSLALYASSQFVNWTPLLGRFYNNYPFFVMGLMLHRYMGLMKKMMHEKKWVIAIMAIIPYVLLIVTHGRIQQILVSVCCAPATLLLLWLIPKRTNRFFVLIGDNAMRLYLLHPPLVHFSSVYMADCNPIFVVAFNFFVFGALSLLIALLIEKAHLTVLLGEHNYHNKTVSSTAAASNS